MNLITLSILFFLQGKVFSSVYEISALKVNYTRQRKGESHIKLIQTIFLKVFEDFKFHKILKNCDKHDKI